MESSPLPVYGFKFRPMHACYDHLLPLSSEDSLVYHPTVTQYLGLMALSVNVFDSGSVTTCFNETT